MATAIAIDRHVVADWAKALFGHDSIVSATLSVGEFPTARIIARVSPHEAGRDACEMLRRVGIDSDYVTGVDLDIHGVTVYRRDRESFDVCEERYEFGDLADG